MSETAPETAPPSPAPRRSAMAALVLGGMIAAGLGYGVAVVYPQGAGSSAEQSAAMQGLQTEIAALRTALAGLQEQDPAPRLSALEAQIAALAPPDLTAIEQRIAALELRPDGGLSPSDAAVLSALRNEVAALKSGGIAQAQLDEAKAGLSAAVADARAEIAALQAQAGAEAARTAQRGAVLQIAAALDSGAPFGSALAALGGKGLPAALTDNAGGLPSLKALQDGFAPAARAALAAALKADMGQTWTERALTFLRTQVGARALTPQTGTGADAALSRAEAALFAGDVAGALAEVSTLPTPAQTAMADWRAGADRHQAAAAALAALTAELGL